MEAITQAECEAALAIALPKFLKQKKNIQEKYPDHELAEPANYWRGSALAFAKKFPEAREVLGAFAVACEVEAGPRQPAG